MAVVVLLLVLEGLLLVVVLLLPIRPEPVTDWSYRDVNVFSNFRVNRPPGVLT